MCICVCVSKPKREDTCIVSVHYVNAFMRAHVYVSVRACTCVHTSVRLPLCMSL